MTRASPANAHILLYIWRPHTAIYVSSCYYMCPHTNTYLAPLYYYISSARIPLYTCPHAMYVPYYYIHVFVPYFQRPFATTLSCPHTTTSHTTVLHTCPHTAACDAICLYYMRVLILPYTSMYTCPHTAIGAAGGSEAKNRASSFRGCY